nr:MAG TPA: hypothetical protein [Caudoviricetes sp.]
MRDGLPYGHNPVNTMVNCAEKQGGNHDYVYN